MWKATRRRFLGLLGRLAVLVLGMPAAARARELIDSIHSATRNTLHGAVGVRLRRTFGGKPGALAHAHPGRERIALGPPARDPSLPLARALARYRPASGFQPTLMPRETLDRLLFFTNGVTGEAPGGVRLRAAPSAGALYAGEVYVVAERVRGLEPGVFAYAPLEGSLAVLARGSHLAEIAAATDAPSRARDAAAAVLLTNVFFRYRQRYANRGYRYALIDSGHIGENLRLAATSAGVAEWGPLRFHDDRLNALLGVDGVHEAVCAMHLIGEGAESDAPPSDPASLVEAWRAGRPLPAAADDAPERYHAQTRLVRASGGERRTAGAEAAGTRPGGDQAADASTGTRLPEPRVPDTLVERAIEIRRSPLRFRREPIAAADLAFVVRAAAGHAPLRRAPGIELLLVIHRVERIANGLYGIRPTEGTLTPRRLEALSEAFIEACLGQQHAGRAAVAFVMVADLESAAADRGERAYRDLCLEAGAVGQRIYLAAEALGLSARNLAAFVDERVNSLLGLDGQRRAALHVTLLGRGD